MRAKLTRDHLTTHMTAPNLNWIANGVLGGDAIHRRVLGTTPDGRAFLVSCIF